MKASNLTDQSKTLQLYYLDCPALPLPKHHRFPNKKYHLLYEKLRDDGARDRFTFYKSPEILRQELYDCHSPSYVDSVFSGTLTREAQLKIGLPWSDVLLQRSRCAVGGSLASARLALKTGCSGQLAGGTHHAHYDHGSGFCVFNDLAVVCNLLLKENPNLKITILDFDVHQGDGNASMLRDNENVQVISIHGARNFPFEKAQSDLDLALPDNANDALYLQAVDDALQATRRFSPQLVLYIAGVDPLADDRLGRLSLTMQGLTKRDETVLQYCKKQAWPITIVVGGGYADPISLSVEAYANTFIAASQIFYG